MHLKTYLAGGEVAYEIDVTDKGYFTAHQKNGGSAPECKTHLRDLEELLDRRAKQTRAARRVKVDVTVYGLDRNGTGRVIKGAIHGLHAVSGKLLCKWEDGTNEQINVSYFSSESKYTLLKGDASAEDRVNLERLVKMEGELTERREALAGRLRVDARTLKRLVEAELERADAAATGS